MTGSISGTSTSDATAIAQKVQDFKDGKINMSKKDLEESVLSAVKKGEKVDANIQSILDSYEKIDKNSDGVSYQELQAYKNTPQGILAGLGISAGSLMDNLPTLLNTELFGNASSSKSTSLLSALDGSSTSATATSKNLASLAAVGSINADTTTGLLELLSTSNDPDVVNAINSYLDKSGQTGSSINSLLDVLS